jgi:hypothetical protein
MSDLEAEGIPPLEDPPPGIDEDNDIEGLVPPGDRPKAATDWGVTPREELLDEPLSDRVKREVPDRVRHVEEPVGRLVAPDEGWLENVDDEPAEVAFETDDDVALSAEEAAMHIIDQP